MAQEPGHRLNILRRAALKLGSWMAAAGGGITFTLTDERAGRLLGGVPAVTGHVINEQSAMRITTAFACVRLLAETVGSVTVHVFERQRNGNAVRVDHDVAGLLSERPNSEMTGLEYREAKTTNLAARGNAYSYLDRNVTGTAASLYPVPAAAVTKKRLPGGAIVYAINDRGKSETVPEEKIWHWMGFGYDGFLGLSPIECARQAMGLALAGEEANSRLFANGLASSAVVKIPQWLKPEQRKLAEEKLATMHAGLLNYGRPYLLEGGMDIAKEGIFAPKDAQFLELRKMQIPELCRIWRISPHMIADLERATNNNIEQLSLEFVMYTMLPYFRRIEERSRMLFKPADRSRFFVRFNFESLLRADSVARAQLYQILLQNGVYNRNEVRELENRNRSEVAGMDDFTVQLNMAPIDQLGDQARARQERLRGDRELAALRALIMQERQPLEVSGLQALVERLQLSEEANRETVSELRRIAELALRALAERQPVNISNSTTIAEGAVRVDAPVNVDAPINVDGRTSIDRGAFEMHTEVQPAGVTVHNMPVPASESKQRITHDASGQMAEVVTVTRPIKE